MKPKSVLLVSDFAYPIHAGTERLVFGIAEWFTNKYNIKTDILVPNWNNLKQTETVNNVTIYRFNTHNINKRSPVQRIFHFVKTGLNLEKYEIYHGFYTVPALASAVALAKLKGAKSIITVFSTEQLEKNFRNLLKKFIILEVLRKTNYVTAYTWKVEKELKEYFPGIPIATTQGWIDRGFGGKRTEKNGWGKIVLFVGRITESKGVFVLLKAFEKIKTKQKARLVLIGPPYEKEKAEETIKKLNLEKRVSLLGFVSEEELKKWYTGCYLVAVPALHADAFGFSLMEALAYGKPVITTEGIGSSELEFPGIIVKPNDVEALAEALLKLLSDKNFYNESKKNAEKMAAVFDKENVMKKYLEIFEKTLS